MKSVLLVLSVCFALAVPAISGGPDPSDRYLAAYFLIQDGDRAETTGNPAQAKEKFSAALAILEEVKTQAPDWHTSLVDFRIQYCAEHLGTAPPRPVRDDGMEGFRQRIQELEASRDSLNAKLQDVLAKVAATQTSPQIEELLKKNAELTSLLAGAQAEITRLRDESPAAETVKLRAELVTVRSENTRLASAQEELQARLAESDRQLHAAKASNEKSDQIIQQLRKENELLRQLAQPSTAKKEPESGGFLWFKPKPKPAPAKPPEPTTSQSEAGKLTATVKAPPTDKDAGESSPEVRVLLAQAQAAMATKDFATAKTALAAAAEKEPNNLSVQTNLGMVLYQLGQLDEAQDTLRKILAVAPNQGASRSLLGIIDLRRGRTEDAYNELTRAVAIDPRNAEAHNYLGIVMNEKGWGAAAEQEMRRALELNPNYADAHFNLAVMYSRQKTPRLELARYHYQKAMELGAARDAQLENTLKQ